MRRCLHAATQLRGVAPAHGEPEAPWAVLLLPVAARGQRQGSVRTKELKACRRSTLVFRSCPVACDWHFRQAQDRNRLQPLLT